MSETAIVENDALEQEPATEQPAEVAEAPESTKETLTKPKVEFTPEQQEFIDQNIVGGKVAKQREAERLLEQERQEKAALQTKLEELTKTERPVIPPLPDQFADDYEEQLAARDEIVRQAANYDFAEQQKQVLAEQQQQQQVEAEAKQYIDSVTAYTDRATKLGIKPEELQKAGQAIATMNFSDDVVRHILAEDQGPSITVYLAANPVEADALVRMSPMQAAAHIATEIKPKAVESRPSVKAPIEPLDNPQGGGFSGSGMPEGSGMD